MSIAIFFVLMTVVGVLEGLQIALLAAIRMDLEAVRVSHPITYTNCAYVLRASDLEAFLVGRQILVTLCMVRELNLLFILTVLQFVVARIAAIDANHEDFKEHGETTFGVSRGVQMFITTGLLGALITTIIGSLVFRVLASCAPLLFLSTPIITFFIRMCLALEYTGTMQFSWVTAQAIKFLFRLRDDNTYLRRVNIILDDHHYTGVAGDTEELICV